LREAFLCKVDGRVARLSVNDNCAYTQYRKQSKIRIIKLLRNMSKSLRIGHCSLLTAHCSLLTAHCSLLTAVRRPVSPV
jgi:hypothetical protein